MRNLFVEYDDIMIGKRTGFSNTYFRKGSSRNMEHALRVMRYAFDRYLRWNPTVLKRRLNKKIMVKMHLQVLMQYINYPIEYDKDKDYYYLVSLLYYRHRLDNRSITIHTYEKLLDGSITKYPKDYFMGTEGLIKAGFCLQYMIEHYIMSPGLDINTLYYIFASEEGYKALKKYRLLSISRDAFETPVDFLHFVLPTDQKNSLLLHYYKYKYKTEMLNNTGIKIKPKTNYKLDI